MAWRLYAATWAGHRRGTLYWKRERVRAILRGHLTCECPRKRACSFFFCAAQTEVSTRRFLRSHASGINL
eukprot:4449421-Pyramimonas_sp.AAC.1